MGCAESNFNIEAPKRLESNIGQLTVHVLRAHLTHVTSTVAEMDPFVVIKIGSQTYQTSTKFKGGRDVEWNEKFEFVINSCFKQFGRQL